MRNQHTEVIKELHSVQEKKPILDHLISESTFMVGELEEKILSAVELLITIKEGRDKIRAEHELVMLDVRELRKSVITVSPSFCSALIFFHLLLRKLWMRHIVLIHPAKWVREIVEPCTKGC
ncbi:hypothetical protein SAY86_011895 [Trapa natans]|uniref:Uncharacterized protein n=1 Tax=Trapa natans TaxID=22666 RepID=A0AAN7LVV7_TRANT|nr:hypothetical protein SAY86_011895 [Trapa natans]